MARTTRKLTSVLIGSEEGVGDLITEVYAYVANHGESGDGICAAQLGNVMFPLVTSSLDLAEQLRPLAEEIRATSGREIRLVKFTQRELVEVLDGG